MKDDEIRDILKSFKPIKTKRNQVLEKEGEICKHFYFINKGCLRLYEIDKKGNEITGYFALEDSFITTLTSFITQKPSRDFLTSYEPAELEVISRQDFFNLTEKYKDLKMYYNKVIEFALIHSQMRIYGFLGMEGIDKLKWVMEHEPKLLTRISSKAVASYLGMTNSTLSKLKAKL
ncbi:Crp/Fnr family transcriptional regulator [Chitinophaga sp. 22321]|uniref:Cyclic nucleotide-binding domain-containing protein n=1 Tax=Chitinophaga hostae TaxID=2831022 RepID=A0ABS5J5Q9_9BACT|nr:cyclic nucleotide-binding domain-containing protein [Chitinophaga hostae]MBS0030563.1 cyclic nucleotide-binding domain-containing protein [Chitinophaga hostae]